MTVYAIIQFKIHNCTNAHSMESILSDHPNRIPRKEENEPNSPLPDIPSPKSARRINRTMSGSMIAKGCARIMSRDLRSMRDVLYRSVIASD